MKWKLLLFAAMMLSAIAANAAELRVEPSSWWIGMSKPTVQLMVYGEDIGELQPVINYSGVKITKIIHVENKNYLFLDIAIDIKTIPGKFPISFEKLHKVVTTFQYELLSRIKGSANRAGFNSSDVIYLVVPDRFANGDTSNDHTAGLIEGANRADENGRHGGDIQGVMDHLDYIRKMGFTSLWLTPVFENNQPSYSYHGYSITDFYHVDQRLGSNSLYRQLCEKARQDGIKMIMDMVFNHCGTGHWWMKDLPTKDWINCMDSVIYTNHRKTVLQDPHAAPSDRRQMVDGWFSKTMPDLNQRNPLLATYLIQNTIWWIEYAGLSGIRVDTYPYPDMNFMSAWSKAITSEYPHINIVGEEWSENPAIVSYWQKGKVNKNGYISYLPGLMDFPVQSALIKALNEKEKYNTGGFIDLYEMLGNDFQYADPDKLVVFADNHDIERFYSLVNEDIGLFKLGMAFVLTSRGIPQVLYGTEILKTGESHGKIRSDFPGGWDKDTVNAFTGEGLTPEQLEAKAFMQTLLSWRKRDPILPGSKMIHYVPHNEVYVYFRYNDHGKIMIVLNKNPAPQQLPLASYADMIGDANQGKNILTGQSVPLTGHLLIPAKSPLIIEWQTKTIKK